MHRVNNLAQHFKSKPPQSHMFIRQYAVLTDDLDRTCNEVRELFKLGSDNGFQDPEIAIFGLKHWVFLIGDTFFEVVCPIDMKDHSNTAVRQFIRRNGATGYMILFQTQGDFMLEKKRIADFTTTILDIGERLPDMKEVHLHPKDFNRCIVSMDLPNPQESWRWAGYPIEGSTYRWEVLSKSSTSLVASELCEVSLEVDMKNINDSVSLWSNFLNCQPDSFSNNYRFKLSKSGQALVLEPSTNLPRGEGLKGLIWKSSDQSVAGKEFRIAGVLMKFV